MCPQWQAPSPLPASFTRILSPCRLPVTALCGPFQRAALKVTAPPELYSVVLLPPSSAASAVRARLPSAPAVSSSRRSVGPVGEPMGEHRQTGIGGGQVQDEASNWGVTLPALQPARVPACDPARLRTCAGRHRRHRRRVLRVQPGLQQRAVKVLTSQLPGKQGGWQGAGDGLGGFKQDAASPAGAEAWPHDAWLRPLAPTATDQRPSTQTKHHPTCMSSGRAPGCVGTCMRSLLTLPSEEAASSTSAPPPASTAFAGAG